MQRIFREAVLLPELRKEGVPFLFTGLRDHACLLPSRISPHLLEALHGLPKKRIVETACRLKVRSQMLGLLAINTKR
jgi:hypothetical protein